MNDTILNLHNYLIFAVDRMEMWRRMFTWENADYHSQKS